MDLFALTGRREDHPAYQRLAIANGIRQYGFLESIITAATEIGRPLFSGTLLKALNFHAIAGLHDRAGKYRSSEVTVNGFNPPALYRVKPLMASFVNEVNWMCQNTDTFELAADALWAVNYIHPFVNGNGRTARAACYFIICVKAGGFLPGKIILPERLRSTSAYPAYLQALQKYDKGERDPLANLLKVLVADQIVDVS